MKTGLPALCIGALFGAGLGLSGMAQPQRIIGFLDFTGAWDPALALVMIGAVGVHFAAQRLAKKRAQPMLAPQWPTYAFTRIDGRLVAGSALFGLGWGLAGYCPAPGILSAAAGVREGLIFVPAMLAGMALFHAVHGLRPDETGQPVMR
jgi:uncharacterized membrane protein YedE/YeeE